MLYPAPMGALTQLWAGTTEEGGKQSGKVRPKNPLRERRPTLIHFFLVRTPTQYLVPWARVGSAKKETNDPETGRKLWEWLEEQVKDV